MSTPLQNAPSETTHLPEDVYVFPASQEQHRYWLLDQVDKASTASNMAITVRLIGQVNDLLIEQCICALTLRHEALRTTFRMIDGELDQVILEHPLYHFAVTDLRNLTEQNRIIEAESVIREHSHVSMNLATGPLFFTRLIHVTDEEHFLCFTMHHIVCDGWSNGILVREFAEYYDAYSHEREPQLPELPFQFADFTVWQKQWLESDAAGEALAFWREQVKGGTPAVDLPTDKPRSARKDGPGDIESQLFPSKLTEKLKSFCKYHEVTNHQLLLATFEAFLSRYTGQEQFLLGSSIANRTQPGMDNVVGRFANPQVVLANVEGNPTFKELLGRVTEWSSLAYAHQDLPFSQLMEEFQQDQNNVTSQFLQVYFVYQRAFMQPQQTGALQLTPRPSVSGGVNFDFLVSIVERAEGPRLQIEYNTDLFQKKRVRKFIDLYIKTLTAVLDRPETTISQLPLLSNEEERVQQELGQGAPLLRDASVSLVEAFDHYASLLEEGPAIVSNGEQVSWRELSEKSIRYARALQLKNIKPGQTVALRLEPHSDAVASALAVLRIGAAVLPVPASVSTNEWTRILADMTPSLALAGMEFAKQVPSTVSFEQLTAPARFLAVFPKPSGAGIALRTLSIHASGEYQSHTVSHEMTARLLAGAVQELNIQPHNMVAVLPSETTTDTWIDLLLPLVHGAGIVYIDSNRPDQLRPLIEQNKVGIAFATPAEWIELTENGWIGDHHLHMICRGGRLSSFAYDQLAKWRSSYLISSPFLGGPISLSSLVKTAPATHSASPLPGQGLAIVDRWSNLVPEGVLGELTVSVHQEKHRTGLLGTYSAENGFLIIGAVHSYIHLRGHSIHLSDLENRLLMFPGVGSAKALVQEDHGRQSVVAYVTGRNGSLPPTAEIIRSLRVTAPQHLACAEVSAVTKIQSRIDGTPEIVALAEDRLHGTAHFTSTDYVPPADDLEHKLVKIWEDVLGIKGIGVRTSFFSLGGYSLLIVRLFARINKTMNTSLPITTIFNAPTIAQLADILRGQRMCSSIVPVQTKGTKQPFFMVLSYLLYGSLPDALGKDFPFYGLRELPGEEGLTPEERATTYVKAMRSIQPEGPYYLGGWCAAGPITIEVARQLVGAGQEVGLVVLFDSWYPGYAESLKRDLKSTGDATLTTRMQYKYDFHLEKMRTLGLSSRIKYLSVTAIKKLLNVRNKLYGKHWLVTTKMLGLFGIPLPDFMHNLTKTTLQSLEHYTPKHFSGDMLLMRASESIMLPEADISCGWNQVIQGDIEVVWAPGDHETMFQQANLEVTGNLLRTGLEKAHHKYEYLAALK